MRPEETLCRAPRGADVNGHLALVLRAASCWSLLALSLVLARADSSVTFGPVAESVKPSVVRFWGTDADGNPTPVGNGFAVGKGVIATEYRTLEQGFATRVRTADGIEYPIDGVLAVDHALDLALVQVHGFYAPPMELLSQAIPAAGERVLVVVVSASTGITATETAIGSVQNADEWGTVLKLTAGLTPDQAGAPLIDAQGRAIGLLHVMSFGSVNSAFSVPAAAVAKLLAEMSTEAVPLIHGAGGRPAIRQVSRGRPLGLLWPRDHGCHIAIPRDGLWRSQHGLLLLPDTVKVVGEDGADFRAVSTDPEKGQYRCRYDGSVRFSAKDAGRRVSVSYQYQGRKIALLPACTSSDYQDAVSLLEQVLTQELEDRGFEMLPRDDVANALADARRGASGASTAADWLPSLAQRLDAAYLLLPAVDANQERVLEGFQTFYSARSRFSVGGSTASSSTTVRSIPLPVVRNVMQVAVGLTVYDGSSGSVLMEGSEADSRRVFLHQFSEARQGLIFDLTVRLVRQWIENPLRQ